MITLLVKSDQPEAELYIYKDKIKIAELRWLADRQLAETIHLKIEELLKGANLVYIDLMAMGIFSGPGSFTGLRISHAVANTLAHTLDIPLISSNGPDWQERAVSRLLAKENMSIAIPDYGRPARITLPRK